MNGSFDNSGTVVDNSKEIIYTPYQNSAPAKMSRSFKIVGREDLHTVQDKYRSQIEKEAH
jgi:hypothetical protein